MMNHILFLFFMSFPHSTDGIQCYLCSGSACDDPFSTDSLDVYKCTTEGSCLKYLDENKGFDFINRGCSSKEESGCSETDLGTRQWWDGSWERNAYTKCYCNTNLCNEATLLRYNSFVLLCNMCLMLWLF